MTEWNITGRKPPMNLAEWEAEFERYKTFPEWQQRKSMTLDEFKFIFWCESCTPFLKERTSQPPTCR